MIIRRRLTRRFTTVDNCLFDDDRLSVEAIGVLCYLLGRPNDWQVKISQIADKFRKGRDRTQRVIREIIEAGYAHREQPRDPETGKMMAVEYVVTDEPVTPEKAPDAADFDDEPQPENTVAANLPQPDLPRPANTVAAYREDSTKTESKKNGPEREARERAVSPGIEVRRKLSKSEETMLRAEQARADVGFMAAWTAWQWRENDDIVLSHRAWLLLTPEERERAATFIATANVARQKPTNRFRLFTYLGQKRWKEFEASVAPGAPANAALIVLDRGSRALHGVFWGRVRRGELTKARALWGQIYRSAYRVEVSEIPPEAELLALPKIAVMDGALPSAEFVAWADELARVGIMARHDDIPLPHIWVPSRWPPGRETERDDAGDYFGDGSRA